MFSDYFYYCPTSPSRLRWINNRGARARANSPAGSRSKNAIYVKFTTDEGDTINTPVARVIWEMMKGSIPDGYVIHFLNGDHFDNSLENLVCINRTTLNYINKTKRGGIHCFKRVNGRVFGEYKKNGVKIPIGTFNTITELEKAYTTILIKELTNAGL